MTSYFLKNTSIFYLDHHDIINTLKETDYVHIMYYESAVYRQMMMKVEYFKEKMHEVYNRLNDNEVNEQNFNTSTAELIPYRICKGLDPFMQSRTMHVLCYSAYYCGNQICLDKCIIASYITFIDYLKTKNEVICFSSGISIECRFEVSSQCCGKEEQLFDDNIVMCNFCSEILTHVHTMGFSQCYTSHHENTIILKSHISNHEDIPYYIIFLYHVITNTSSGYALNANNIHIIIHDSNGSIDFPKNTSYYNIYAFLILLYNSLYIKKIKKYHNISDTIPNSITNIDYKNKNLYSQDIISLINEILKQDYIRP